MEHPVISRRFWLRRTGQAAVALALGAAARPLAALQASDTKAELLEARKLWDEAPHNAFTDLIRFQDRWYCVFREGKGHVSPDGALRVLTSPNGIEWESAARITSADSDLRDAKIAVTPRNELMLTGAGAFPQPNEIRHQSYAWFSKDGRSWSDAVPIGDPNYWLWRTTWHQGVGYALGYRTRPPLLPENRVRLYQTRDGRKFDQLADEIYPGSANEHSFHFKQDGTAYCLLRRDVAPFGALLGTSRLPYTHWTWKDTGTRLGGPHVIELPDGRLVAAGRLHMGKVRTGLCWLDPDAGTLTEFLTLPSGGDTSYPGLVMHRGELWVSYYSSHEGKTNIYLARVRLPRA